MKPSQPDVFGSIQATAAPSNSVMGSAAVLTEKSTSIGLTNFNNLPNMFDTIADTSGSIPAVQRDTNPVFTDSQKETPSIIEDVSSFVNVSNQNNDNDDDDDEFGDFHDTSNVSTTLDNNQSSITHTNGALESANLNFEANVGSSTIIQTKYSDDDFGDFHDPSMEPNNTPEQTSMYGMPHQEKNMPMGMNGNETNLKQNHTSMFPNSMNKDINAEDDDFGDFHHTATSINGIGNGMNGMNNNGTSPSVKENAITDAFLVFDQRTIMINV